MKHLVLGTAGHIDHGKTALVKALTGIDCDRLPEEKARGITIELGFAHLQLADDIRLGIVDVPGHERFVRTMVAGVAGMDLVLLVVAADEGVMPQTREHLAICQLLGVESGLVVLTKSDLVEPDWLELQAEELREVLADTFLAAAPIVPVSAKTGAGLDDLRRELVLLATACRSRRADGPFRLPIDRVFTVAGFGTVVTGTLLSGTLAVGDELAILPGGIVSRVRGLQSHGGACARGGAGERLAVNLQGVEHSAVTRGDTLVPPGVYGTTRTVDVLLRQLPSAPAALKHRAILRLHAGAGEMPVQVTLFDRATLEPGGECFAQLRASRELLLLPGDPFVLRSYSPATTVGGGRVLDPLPPRRRRRSAEALALLAAAAAGDDGQMVARMIAGSLLSGISAAELVRRTGFAAKRLDAALQPLLTSGEAVTACREPRIYLGRAAFAALQELLCHEAEEHRCQHPLQEGVGKEELRSRLPRRSDRRFFTPLLQALEKEGRLLAERDIVRLPGRQRAPQPADAAIGSRIEQLLQQAGNEAPTLRELSEALGLEEKTLLDYLNQLAREQRAVKVKSDIFHSPAAVAAIREQLVAYLREHDGITPGEFRELTGLSRKFMIPLLEYFDQEKLTIRVGDRRVLRRR